jgi:hypothetical protein
VIGSSTFGGSWAAAGSLGVVGSSIVMDGAFFVSSYSGETSGETSKLVCPLKVTFASYSPSYLGSLSSFASVFSPSISTSF